MLPHIEQILSVDPYKIICRWSTGEIRIIDLEPTIKSKSHSPESSFAPLLNPIRFREVQLDPESKTIFWANGSTMIDYDGTRKPAPLDFCPDMLYNLSIPAY
ncbi:MAG: DUF2442 domain-containing protein [Ignavibacteriales bacterium]|nr:DUF2442 domain-containing protein [Ignavibacteriales bacterium]